MTLKFEICLHVRLEMIIEEGIGDDDLRTETEREEDDEEEADKSEVKQALNSTTHANAHLCSNMYIDDNMSLNTLY